MFKLFRPASQVKFGPKSGVSGPSTVDVLFLIGLVVVAIVFVTNHFNHKKAPDTEGPQAPVSSAK